MVPLYSSAWIIEEAAADLLTLLFGGEEKGQAHQVAADIGDGEGDLVAIPHLFHPNFIFLLAAQQGKHIIQGSSGALPHGGGRLSCRKVSASFSPSGERV